jgi:hypothetical protein
LLLPIDNRFANQTRRIRVFTHLLQRFFVDHFPRFLALDFGGTNGIGRIGFRSPARGAKAPPTNVL